MMIDWPSLILGTSPLLFGLAIRFLLDMNLWPGLIKSLSWVPVRAIFRTNPPDLRGDWDVYWDANSDNFKSPFDRHKTARMYQLGGFCYASYAARDRRYCMIGKIEGSYLTGVWHDIQDVNGYRGSFQLRIVNQGQLRGRWLGFSTTKLEINSSSYEWNKNPS